MKFGLQSITLWNEFNQDFYGTLERLADVGLHYVEWFNIASAEEPGIGMGLSPKDARIHQYTQISQCDIPY